MNIIDTEKNKILMWNEGVEVDAFAMEQLRNLANHPFLHRHVAVMPDAHAGMGATIGSVFCADSAVIPSAVGVDIGCGMMLQQTGKLIDEALLADLPRIKQDILKWIPVGFRHQKVLRKAYRVGTLTELQSRFEAQRADPEFDPQSMEGIEYLNYIDPDSIKSRVPRLVLAAQDEMVSMLSDDLLCPADWVSTWRRIRDEAGFKGRWVQDVLRHTFASYHAKHYRDMSLLQWNMGHRDQSLLRARYVNLQGITRQAAARFFS